MVGKPPDTPTTLPTPKPTAKTVAILVLLLVQLPPPVASFKLKLPPTQVLAAPVIGDIALIVIDVLAVQLPIE
jgi:hypothetical protein